MLSGTVDEHRRMASPIAARLRFALLTLAIVVGCGPAAPDHGGHPRLPPPLPPAPLDAAGTLPGTAAVQQGAFTYRIALQVPGGRMGVQPELALHYGSRSTEPGILGVGWSLAGLSTIARCPKTRAAHGISETVRFDASDSFCLDGAKLHAIDGTYGAPGAEYRAERAEYARIVSFGQLPDGGPEYFTVWTRDGQVLEYGRTAGARGQADLGGDLSPAPPAEDMDLGTDQHIDGPRASWKAPVTLSWYLSSARDRLGNALQVTYLDGGPSSALRVPHEIRYTGQHQPGGAVTGATRKVRFLYEHLPGAQATYLGGVSTTLTRRLSAIEMHAPAPEQPAMVWRYALDHAESLATGRSLLRAVRLCDAAGSCLAPTRFTWDEVPVSYELVSAGSMAAHPDSDWWTRLLLADLDGDGDDDLVYAAHAAAPELEHWQRPARLYARLSNGLGAPVPFGPHIDLSGVLPAHYQGVDLHRSRAASLRGGNNADLLLARGDDATVDVESGSYRAYTWHNGGLASLGDLADVTYLELDLADVTGDGLTDLFAEQYDCQDPATCPWRFAPHGGTEDPVPAFAQALSPIVDTAGQPILQSAGALAVDLYNDGQADLLAVSGVPGARIIGRTRHGDFGYQWVGWDFGTDRSFADVNGDGLPDAVHGVDGAGSSEIAEVRLNTGVGFLHPPQPTSVINHVVPGQNGWHPDVSNAYRWADFDGDGRADLLFLDLWPPDGTNYANHISVVSNGSPPGLFLSRAGHFEGVYLPFSGYRLRHQAYWSAYGWSGTEVGDLDGDGLPEIVQLAAPGWYDFHYDNHRAPLIKTSFPEGPWVPAPPPEIQVLRPKRRGLPDKLVEVVDGLGRVDQVRYAPITDAAVYTPGSGCQHPQRCLRRGVEVVARHQVLAAEDATEPSADFAYTYADARADVQGRGFLGFGRITRRDEVTATTTEERYENRLGLMMCPGHVYPFAGLPVETRTTAPLDDDGTRFQETRVTTRYCARFLDWATVSSGDYTDIDDYFDHGPPKGRSQVEESTACVLESRGAEEQPAWFQPDCGLLRERSYAVEVIASEEVLRWLHGASTTGPVVRVKEERSHDRWGNVEEQTTTIQSEQGNIVDIAETRVVDTLWESHGDDWLIGLPYRVTERSTVAGQTKTRRTLTNFSPITGLLESRIDQPQGGNDERLTTIYERHPAGQIRITREAAPGYAPRETLIEYDTDGVYPRRTINAEGHETWWTFDPAHGQLARRVDPNGVETSWQYDGLGRLRKTIAADGYVQERRYVADPLPGSRLAVRDLANTGEDQLEAVDGLGRPRRRRWKHFDGSEIAVAFRYDDAANAACHTLPAPVGETAPEGCLITDALGRKRSLESPDGTARTWRYPSLLEAIAVDEEGDEQSVVLDAAGRVKERRSLLIEGDSEAPLVTSYRYGPFGDLGLLLDPEGAITTITTDALGRRVQIEDPNAGTMRLAYTPFGELRREASGTRVSEYQHDRLGRVTYVSMSDPGGFGDHRESLFAYDACAHGAGSLCASTSVDLSPNAAEITIEHAHDPLGRPHRRRWLISTPWASGTFQVDWDYDSFGRPKAISYPDVPGISPRFSVEQSYQNGFLAAVRDTNTGEATWAAESYAPDGRLEVARLGNQIRTSRTYDPLNRRLLSQALVHAGTGQKLEAFGYTYHDDGNVETRERRVNHAGGQTWMSSDAFTYDAVDRLRTWTSAGDRAAHVEHEYSASGNLLRVIEHELGGALGAVEEATYDAAHPQQIESFTDRAGVLHAGYQHDALGRLTQGFIGKATLEVDYTTHDLPRRISDGTAFTYFEYDAHGRRTVKMRDAATAQSTVYIDELYELRDGGEHVFHVFAGDQRVAQVTYAGPQLSRSMRYLHEDPLGTVGSVSDESGAIVERFDYLPFGARMDAAGMPLDESPSMEGVRHGFTGHEHDDELGLINMKGRLYAPALRRFLSPDPLSEPGLRVPLSCLHDACDTAGADPPDRIARNRVGAALGAEEATSGLPLEARGGRRAFQGDIATRSQTQAGALHATLSGGGAVPRRSQTAALLQEAAAEGLELPSGQAHHRYSYARNNPVRLADPSGLVVETPVDVILLALDVMSLARNVASSQWTDAAIDAGTIVADVGATAIPGVPAVAGVAVRAGRAAAQAAPKLAKATGKIADAAKAAADAVGNAAKKVPNPHGSKGGPEHQAKIRERIQELEAQGHKHLYGGPLPETNIKVGNGKSRRPDIITEKPDGTRHHENVGLTNKSGKPIPREQRALDDLERTLGERPTFTPYEKSSGKP